MNKSIIPTETIENWQKIATLIAELLDVPAGLIMKVEPTEIEVFVSSESKGNPYKQGERAKLNSGLYCETVMKTRDMLLVPDAMNSEKWKTNPDIELGMISYLGFPICWPDDNVFGTICALDYKANNYNQHYKNLLLLFRDIIESDLKTIMQSEEQKKDIIEESKKSRLSLLSILEDVQQSQKVLHRNEQVFRLFIEHSPASIAMFDLEMKYLVASKRFNIDYGLGDMELTGHSHYDIFPEITERWKEIHKRCLKGETIREEEDQFPRADGKIDWVRWEIRPWYENDGKIGGIILFSEVITEWKETKDALLESEVYNRMLFDQSVIGLAVAKMDGKLIDVNQAYADIIGRTIEETLKLTYWDITPEKYKEQEKKQLELLENSGKYGPYEKEYIHKNGQYIPVRLKGNTIEREGQKLIWSSVEDITERIVAEKSIREREEKLELFFEQSLDGFFFMLLDEPVEWNEKTDKAKTLDYVFAHQRITKINDAMLNQYLAKREDYIGVTPSVMFAHDIEYGKEVWRQFFDKGKLQIETDERKTDGSQMWVEGDYICLYDEKGRITGHFGIQRDVTDRKIVEKQLKESEELLRLSTELANVAAWEFDFTSNSMQRSKNHDSLYGLEIQEKWAFETFVNATHPDDRDLSNATINNSVAIGGPNKYKFDFRVVYPDKSIHWLNVIGEVIKRNDKGEGILVRGFIIDITDRKRAAEEIKKLNIELEDRVIDRTAQLEKINQELKTFTYSVSHDLKAPLRGIDGYSKLLQEMYSKELHSEAQVFIKNIRKGTVQMSQIIEDLLAYSRLERAVIKQSETPLNLLIETIVSIYQKEIDDYGIIVHQNIPEVFVKADIDGLTIAFRNIFENAIKFSKKQISPEINIGFEEDNNKWLILVEDNGIGFDMNYKDKIFEIFQRLHRIEDYPGTGIGLAMVAKAMKRMGGNVWAESEKGKGAKFYLEIKK